MPLWAWQLPHTQQLFFFFLWDWNDINECDLLILYDKMYQHLENLYNSVKQHFPNDQCLILWNHTWVKYATKGQDRPMGFNVIEYKSSLIWFQMPHCGWPSRNYHLLSFGIVSKKNAYSYLKWQLKYSLPQIYVCVRPHFFQIHQPK